MDFEKLRKTCGAMQDYLHTLLTWAKYHNDIAILYHSATRLTKILLR